LEETETRKCATITGKRAEQRSEKSHEIGRRKQRKYGSERKSGFKARRASLGEMENLCHLSTWGERKGV